MAECMLQLDKQREEFSETLRRQELYQQSVHDISDRLDQLRSCLDTLRHSVQSPLTADELDNVLHAAEVSCFYNAFTEAMVSG